MPTQLDPGLAAFIQRLPKTETHLHIEGSMPIELCRRVDPVKFADPPPSWRDDYRFNDFAEFQALFDDYFFRWYVSPENYHESCVSIFNDIVAQNGVYLECSFHLGTAERIKVPLREIAVAIHAARPAGLELRLFLGMFRDHHDKPDLARIVEEALGWEEIAGFDLHGFENPQFQPWAIDLWARARANGKVTKAHAGEFSPAEDVRQAVEELGVTRVQHGLSALEDPTVMALLRDKDVTLDMTPISNVKLRAVPSMHAHPIRRFIEAGVRCTVSTDDPMVFGNSLSGEYAALADEAGFTRAELAKIADNGFAVADLPFDMKADYRATIARLSQVSV